MTPSLRVVFVLCASWSVATHAAAQSSVPDPVSAAVALTQGTPAGPPRVFAMSGTIVNAGGQPQPGAASLTFALYATRDEGAVLWSETQTVQADERGRYTVWLGSQTPLPVELFQTTEARWLGVRTGAGAEVPRVRLVSVPYALKSGDAETLGGLPASAYLRSAGGASGQAKAPGDVDGNLTTTSVADSVGPAGFENSSPPYATAYGYQALANNALSGSANSAFGYQAMFSNTTGNSNTAAGTYALNSNTSGVSNTAAGLSALNLNTTGNANTAAGTYALALNTTGSFNTAAGLGALMANKSGGSNTAAGFEALDSNSTGSRNVGFGYLAGHNATGSDNVYIANEGVAGENGAIYLGTAGTHAKTVLAGNIGVGTTNPIQKLDVRGSGSTYASVGAAALGSSPGNAGLILNNGAAGSALVRSNALDGSFIVDAPNGAEHLRIMPDGRIGVNTPNPLHALTVTTANSSYVNLVSLGGNAGHIFTSVNREAVIRLNAADGSFAWENPNGIERMRITDSGEVGIGTTTPTNPLQMGSGAFVSAGGVWTNASSRALKRDITDLPADRALDTFAQLRPVLFAYTAEPGQTHVGFIAEDVPDLVATSDRKGLSAMDIVAVAVKVVQAQQTVIQTQQTTIGDLKAKIETVEARLARLEALLAAMAENKR